MASAKPPDQTFVSQWNKIAAWAQTQGISLQTYAPVYQQDLGRLQQGEYPMSQAERTRAILAAQNPNNVTPTPSDHPSPWSFFGNMVNDARNIFTGLAPNHLIPNVWHTAEAAVAHPQTWLTPLEDVSQGILTGNMGDIRKGFQLASGPGSILSWVPGVTDVSEALQGRAGWDYLLSHPISSFLDAVPFAPVGRVLGLVADESRMAAVATHLGMPVDQLYHASIPKMGASWILSRPVTDVEGEVPKALYPGIGKLTRVFVNPNGTPLTLGDAFKMWGQYHTGLSRTAAHMAAAAFDLRSYGTEAEMYTVAPLQMAEEKLTQAQQTEAHGLVRKTDPRSQGVITAAVMANDSIDPAVRDDFQKFNDVLDMGRSRTLASGGIVQIEGPTFRDSEGNLKQSPPELFSAVGQPHPVLEASRKAHSALYDLMRHSEAPQRITLEVARLDTAAERLVSRLDDTRKKANGELVSGRITAPVRVSKKGRVLEAVSLPLQRQAALLTGEDGLIARIADAASTVTEDQRPKQADYQSMVALTSEAKKALTRDGYASVDATRSETLLELRRIVGVLHQYAVRRVADEKRFYRGLTETKGSSNFQEALTKAIQAQQDFEKAWWDNPPDRWRSVLYDEMKKQIAAHVRYTDRFAALDERLRRPHAQGGLNWSEQQVRRLQSDPRKLAEAIDMETRSAASNIGGQSILDDQEIREIRDSAIDEVNRLREQGHEVVYTPAISTLDISERDPGRYGVGIAAKGVVKELSMARRREMKAFVPERHDLMAAVHLATKEAIQRDITIEFVDRHLAPHSMTAGEVADWARRAFPDEYSGYDPADRNAQDLLAEHTARRLGLTRWDPASKVGFSFPRWHDQAIYLPSSLADAVDKLLVKTQFPLDGFVERATGLFRFSILGLSPRYTAHIVFGGSFLLALRSSPHVLTQMTNALKMVKNHEMPTQIVQRATEPGVEPVQYRTLGLNAAQEAGGRQLGNMLVQSKLKQWGIDWRKANPVQWAKAAGEMNFRFTNWVVKLQRSLAYLDYAKRAERRGYFRDPETGQKIAMTPERAEFEGIQHALKAMGDLKSMTPFERSVMTRVMPFYGWTRHILGYVLTYPVDHPFRAQFLSVLADHDSNSIGKAFDKRIQFLFFLGKPDPLGNVSAVDIRFADPLRDVANYATLGGVVSSLSPLISGPLTMLDPQIIYGSTSLYPNVSYDSFYGIEVAGSQGSPVNALEQIVPQVGALDAALNLSGQYRNLAAKNPQAFAKTVFEALNIPFAQVQHLNLRQLAAKGEIARYDVAKAAATNAFQTGDFKLLDGFASVPNPLNPDYEITPAQLQAVYDAAATAYPSLPPAETVVPPNTPSGL